MAGTYTDVIEIVAPSSAAAGETVPVTIKIKNIWTGPIHVAAIGVYDTEEQFIKWLKYVIPAGATHSFSGSFIMPAMDVTIHAFSYYEDIDGYWRYDDEDEKNVSLGEVFQGTISRKELEYDGARANIPAYDLPQGQRGLVHIWGRNDMSSNQKMGIWWQVRDPEGAVVEEYATWETYWTGPGNAQEFIGGRFNLDKPGTYTVAVQLFMNPADQVSVDDYYGSLCSVTPAVPEPEFRGFGVAEYQTV